jgi:hypothetical protein
MIKTKHFKEAWVVSWREMRDYEGKVYEIRCQIWLENEDQAIDLTRNLAVAGIDSFGEALKI